MSHNYDFPVALKPVFTAEGHPVPRIQAIVREDTGEVISAASHKYLLIPHQEVIGQAESFIRSFGNPEASFSTTKNGGRMVGTFYYKEIGIKVAKGDMVGLKVFIENSYNCRRSVRVKIGALVLSCLNGMVSAKDFLGLSFRHVVGAPKINFPSPDEVISMFQYEAGKWARYGDIGVSSNSKESLLKQAADQHILPSEGINHLKDIRVDTVWDLMQGMTYYITHTNQKLSPIGKMGRLQKVSQFFDQKYETINEVKHATSRGN